MTDREVIRLLCKAFVAYDRDHADLLDADESGAIEEYADQPPEQPKPATVEEVSFDNLASALIRTLADLHPEVDETDRKACALCCAREFLRLAREHRL